MKPTLFSLFLLLLLVLQQVPAYAQKSSSTKKTSSAPHVVTRQVDLPDLLGNPASPCSCGIPCPELDSLQAIYLCVDQMPKPPGGDVKEYLNTLTKQVHIPVNEPRLEGSVGVSFTVTPTGQLTGFRILRSLSPTYDAEAIRVLQAQPPWSPGYQDGRAVRVWIQGYVPFPPQ